MRRDFSNQHLRHKRIALMLPVLNEELTVAKVIQDFRKEIPHIDVYVFDNRSTDRSRDIAIAEGARVISVPKRGKGNVVRKMFEMVDADIYIMVDADDTYDSAGVHRLLEPVLNGEADMVVGSRLTDHSEKAFRKFHRFGNHLILRLINFFFGSQLVDILSGYRVMSRYFVRNIPFMRDGFEIETELTVYSLILGFSVKEVSLPYRHRPPNSHSKLRTFADGYKVLLTIVWLARDLRPLLFFAFLSLATLALVTLPLFLLAPEAVLWQVGSILGSLCFAISGIVLNTIHVRFQELQILAQRNYMAMERARTDSPSHDDIPTAALRPAQPLSA